MRLFVSGESWYERTRQILGLAPGAPDVTGDHPHEDHHDDHRMAFWRITTRAAFALSTEGLAQASEMEAVLVDRTAALSRTPEREDVLILAHGTGDDVEDERCTAYLEARADAVRKSAPYRVQGFGPYARVLDGLDYMADGRGLLPHPNVGRWIEKQIDALRAAPYSNPGS